MIKIDKLNTLSERERLYFDIMSSGNSLYLRGKPGMAKSAIGLSISKKLGIKYLDKRLSQIDETDIGLYPVLTDSYNKLEKITRLKKIGALTEEEYDKLKLPLIENIKENKQTDILHFAIPEWAFNSNLEPTIIHLEELNRASVHVRNAALQILNERQIGDLKLNDNVFLMSSGNLGEEDGTEIDEMDLALSNRLVIVDHNMPYDEWIREFAEKYVWKVIVDYIKSHPLEYYKLPNEREIRYATPRSWTNLSKFIEYKWGKNPDLNVIINFLLLNGRYFIGDSITGFIRYCQDMTNINLNDILNRWDNIKDEVKEFNRSRISELITNLKHLDLKTLNDYQIDNILRFLDSLQRNDDEVTSYLIHLLDNTNDNNFKLNNKILSHFKSKMNQIKKYISSSSLK